MYSSKFGTDLSADFMKLLRQMKELHVIRGYFAPPPPPKEAKNINCVSPNSSY